MKLKIKKNDRVMVIAGKGSGYRKSGEATNKDRKPLIGRVLEVYPERQMVLVEGVNMRTKAVRPSQENPNGGLIKQAAPIHVSNVMLVDDNGNPTRVSIKVEVGENGKRKVTRIAKTTKKALD
jgi:large subunit ribosomal protein L24